MRNCRSEAFSFDLPSPFREGFFYYWYIKMECLNKLALSMTEYETDAGRIQHFFKVHAFSKLIGEMERLDAETLLTLEVAAYVHDIGIPPALEKYGSDNGSYQEELGPAIAEKLLKRLDYDEKTIRRVSYLVGHHHTYSNIDGMDYQILVEADFLVNLHENHCTKERILHVYETIFRTEAGKKLCREMFQL